MTISQEDIKRYEAILAVFTSEGWKYIMEEYQVQLANMKEQGWNLDQGEALLVMKGMITERNIVVNWPAYYEQAYEFLKEQEAEE